MAAATPISFDVAGAPASSVTLSNIDTWGRTYISVNLVDNLGSTTFTLDDGQSQTFPFFNVTVGGLGGGTADVQATLAFELPPGSGAGSGSGGWATFMGIISGGYLTWTTQPPLITLPSGDSFTVTFENIIVGGLGTSTTVDATVTAHAATAPVPEPDIMILLGISMVSVAGLKRWWKG